MSDASDYDQTVHAVRLLSVLCGIGFTMSLFIGNLAFAESPLLVDEVKVGVLAGSVLAALAGMLILRFSPSHPSR